MSRGQETNSSARWRVYGMRMRMRSGLSLFTATARGSRMCICSNPPSPIPMHITIRQGLTSNTTLRWWYWPFWRSRIVSGTRAKGEWYILRTCQTQMEEQLDCHLLCNGVAFLSHQPFIIIHGIGRSGHLIQIWKGLTSNPLGRVMRHHGSVAFCAHLRGC